MSNIKGHDMGLRYEGRVVKLELWINTDTPLLTVAKAVEAAARGPRNDAILAALAAYKGDKGKAVWEAVQDTAMAMPDNPLIVVIMPEDMQQKKDAVVYDCNTALHDLAALREGNLSIGSRLRLLTHIETCSICCVNLLKMVEEAADKNPRQSEV